MSDPDVRAAQKELNDRVLDRPGVTGTAVGLRGEHLCLKVYVTDAEAARKAGIPSSVRGVPVDVEVTGTFRRL
ncbi:MAG: hypothetical protein D6701_05225 [Gemmatimonadetes bacterium]|nr:MAG: hypothetical protein D6701_05225 [Gemmatimonadota bacterium]